jgi:paired amphipathic helix protein Sin3a
MTNSPEDYDGVRIRRNTYEEVMFRIEDERYEVDMAIERNAQAMRQIEPYAEEVSELRQNEEKDGQPIGRLQYQLKRYAMNSILINAIGRVYGENGDEVLQHLARNPLVVLPTVYQRLRQKDSEWRKAKLELRERWNALYEENYEGSMDYLCYFYRKALERSFASHQLLDVRIRRIDEAPRKECCRSSPLALFQTGM